MNFSKKGISYANLALCILLWASIPVASKKILVELDNLQMLFYSTAFSLAVLAVLLVAHGKHKELRRYGARDYGIMAWLGFLGTYLYYVLLYGAFARTTASEGFILAYTWPIFVLGLAFLLLGETVTWTKISAVAVSFLGVAVIFTHGDPKSLTLSSLTGDLIAVTGAFVFALFSVLGKKRNDDQTISVFVYFVVAMISVVVTTAACSSFVWPSARVWGWLAYNGVLVNGVSYIFWFKALEHGDTHVISSALYLTPFLSLVYIRLFLDERILPSSVAGLGLILAGIAVQLLGPSKPRSAEVGQPDLSEGL